MESNGDGSMFLWGMSIASKRAKERQNRSSVELVVDKTKISRSLKLQVTDVREGRKSVNSVRVRCSGRPEKVGRPVLRGGPDVRKSSVVQWVGVNTKFQIQDAILGGNW